MAKLQKKISKAYQKGLAAKSVFTQAKEDLVAANDALLEARGEALNEAAALHAEARGLEAVASDLLAEADSNEDTITAIDGILGASA